MSQIDLNAQWRELQENYGAMSDEELEAVAQEAYDLTDIAKQALKAEISHRNLKIELQETPVSEAESEQRTPPEEYPPGFDPEDWGLINFTNLESLERAREIKQCFDDAGIPSYFGPNLVDDLRLLPAPFPGSVQVKIRETDKNRAIAVLNRCAPSTENQSEDEIPDYSGRCPKCKSAEIVFQGLDEPSEESASDSKYNWSCDACGYQWKDDGIEAET